MEGWLRYRARPRRFARRAAVVSSLGAALVLVASLPAGAVHDTGVYELDADAAVTLADDADAIYNGTSSAGHTVFVHDAAEPDLSVHKSDDKDGDAMSAWGCVGKSNVTDKLDIREAWGSTYVVGGDLHVYFGATRDSNSGDANVGIWLFQDVVGCVGSSAFSGVKTDGDLLLVFPFEGGGSISSVDLYQWADPDGIPGNGDEFLGDGLTPGVALVTGADCNQTPEPPGHHTNALDALVCGTANGVAIPVAWQAGTVDASNFVEGGLNLTGLVAELGLEDRCYRTFQVESRASQQLTAQLEDYAGGALPTCATIAVEKVTAPSGSPQLFDFSVDGGSDPVHDAYQLADGDPTHVTDGLKPGDYSVTEGALPAGWTLEGAFCSGGPFGGGAPYTNGDLFALGLGDEVVCTFTNVQAPQGATISVDKVTDPAGSPQQFGFSIEGAGGTFDDDFSLADADPSHTTVPLTPGPYSVTEGLLPAGWDLTAATCAGGPFGDGAPYTPGAEFAVVDGDHVVCTFVNDQHVVGVDAAITVDKVVAAGDEALPFSFATAGGPDPVSDAFALTDTDAPHTTDNLDPGSYTVTETVPAGWVSSATCSGGPFGEGAPYTNGTTIELAPGDHVTCTFVNLQLRPDGWDFCSKGTLPCTGNVQFPKNLGPDHVVRVDLGESIQTAVDMVGDNNGDGYIIVGVSASAGGAYGGTTTQDLVIDRDFPKPFGLFACSVTMKDPTPTDGQPVGKIAAGASAPQKIYVMDLHATGSDVEGWLVEDGAERRTLRNVTSTYNGLGYRFLGDDNELKNSKADLNASGGIVFVGNDNEIRDNDAYRNGGDGILVTGSRNLVIKNEAGERNRGNAGSGIVTAGPGNTVRENESYANTRHGYDISGGTAAQPTTVYKNRSGDSYKGNLLDGYNIHDDIGNAGSSPYEVAENKAKANRRNGLVITAGASGHQLRNNVSGGSSSIDNLDCEFVVASGNLNATGNKANGVAIAGTNGSPFPTGCLGTP